MLFSKSFFFTRKTIRYSCTIYRRSLESLSTCMSRVLGETSSHSHSSMTSEVVAAGQEAGEGSGEQGKSLHSCTMSLVDPLRPIQVWIQLQLDILVYLLCMVHAVYVASFPCLIVSKITLGRLLYRPGCLLYLGVVRNRKQNQRFCAFYSGNFNTVV